MSILQSVKREISFLPQFLPLIDTGRKTETRRPLQLKTINLHEDGAFLHGMSVNLCMKLVLECGADIREQNGHWYITSGWNTIADFECQYGKPGDLLKLADVDMYIQITKIEIQRIQDITEANAIAEGMGSALLRDCKVPKFSALWDSIYLSNFPWASNPWVWVISFMPVREGAQC